MSVSSVFPPKPGFDRTTIAVMETAFDRVCDTLQCGHALTLVKMAAAMHIMALAEAGERDPERLCALSLAAIGFRQPAEPDRPVDSVESAAAVAVAPAGVAEPAEPRPASPVAA